MYAEIKRGKRTCRRAYRLDPLAHVKIHGNLHDSTGVDSRGLGTTLNGIALEARVGLGDLGLDEHGRINTHEVLVCIQKLANVILAQPLRIIADEIGRDRNLIVGLHIHEVVVIAIAVEILHLGSGEGNALELRASVAGLLDNTTSPEVLGLIANERTALARLDMLELDDSAILSLILRPRPFLKSAVVMLAMITFLTLSGKTLHTDSLKVYTFLGFPR